MVVAAAATVAPTPTDTPMPTATPFSYGAGLPLAPGEERPLTEVETVQSWWVAPVQIAPWVPQQIAGLFRPWVVVVTLVALGAIGFAAWRGTRRLG